jgi:hypothetical protein
MSSVLVHPPEAVPRSRRIAIVAAGLVASLAILAGLLALVRRPDFVDRVTIDNRSGFALEVDVAPGPHDAIMPLGVVDSRSSQEFDDVVDQGDVWVVHLADPGEGAKALRFSRSQLEQAHWRVVVPAGFDPMSS